MCAVSMITDYYRDKWPLPQQWQQPFQQGVIGQQIGQQIPVGPTITWEQWNEYLALKARMAEYDKRTGQPDCEKPDVAEWEAKIEAYLKKRGLIPQEDAA